MSVNKYINGQLVKLSGGASNIATTATAGLVKPDGTTITISNDGTISADSGHTIVDESDVSYTKRSKLKFVNATITDDSTNDATIITVEGGGTTIVQKPTVTVGTYTYNGSAQGPTITGLDSDNTVVTNATKTDAGTYTLTIALKNSSSMVWNDMTNAALTYEYTINKQTLTIPTVTDTSKTYNGEAQGPTVTGFDSSTMTKTGDTATNAGDYTISFGLVDTDNYQWDNGSTSASWSIAKATPTLTLSQSAITLDSDTLSSSFTITYNGDGALSISGYDTSVISAALNDTTVTVTALEVNGSTTVTVNAAAGSNYLAATATCTITCDFLAIVTFADGTDAEIAAMLEAYYNDQISWSDMGWAVGNTRTISLNSMAAPNPNSSNTWDAQTITLVIVAHDHTDLATPINGHTKACITVQTRECMNNNTATYNAAGHIYVNGDSAYDTTFTKWSNLYMRTYLNSVVFGAIPTGDFKSAIKPSVHYRHTTYNGTESEEVTDTLFLPSSPEVYGTGTINYYTATSPTEGTQFKYYETAANRIKYGNNNGASNGIAQYYWTGSASNSSNSSRGYYWCFVYTDGSSRIGYGIVASGLSPAFAM